MSKILSGLFPYVGEELLRDMFQSFIENENPIGEMFGMPNVKFKSVSSQVSISTTKKKTFDGLHKIDIGLRLETGAVFPVEVKLGRTRLSVEDVRRVMDDSPVDLSMHKPIGKRLKGNMMSVLRGNYDEKVGLGREDLRADWPVDEWNVKPLKLTKGWGVIAHSSVIKKWRDHGVNNLFESRVKLVSIETICEQYDHKKFNKLVESKLGAQKYDELWLEGR